MSTTGPAVIEQPGSAPPLTKSVYAILITLSLAAVAGRILAVDAIDQYSIEQYLYNQGRADWQRTRPFLSANDRSRWATVRSLVEQGTYSIDDIVSQQGWDTIDMVQHRGRDGELHLYSSKPPLLATLMAGEYWLIYHLGGYSLERYPHEIGRFMLLTINLPTLLICFVLLGKLAERLAVSPWSRIFMMAGAAFGTFLTTFAVSINNHLIGAMSALVAVAAATAIWYDGRREARYFIAAGFFGAFMVANELPALAMFALISLGLAWKAPRQTLLCYLPAAAIVAAASFGTNYVAHGELRPAYSHRTLVDGKLVESDDDWYLFEYPRNGKMRKSYWHEPAGVDQGEPSRVKYLLHCTLGHHGIVSLTPIWLLSMVGLGLWWREGQLRALSALIAGVSLIVFAFYITRPAFDCNYGGVTSGLRWMFWFAPLWLLALLPTCDRMAGCRWRRGVALALLGVSVVSASYPTWNPWTQPWLMHWMEYAGWIAR